MDERCILNKHFEGLATVLPECIEHFRAGEDAPAIEAFIFIIDDIESIVHKCAFIGDKETLADIEVPLERIHGAVNNRDITGIADTLEFILQPLVKAWPKGDGKP